jgi:hypothetical protein
MNPAWGEDGMNLRLEHEKRPRSPDHDSKWDAAIVRLEKLRELQDDWDGNNAPAPSGELIDAVRNKLEELRRADHPPPSSIAPTFDGTISIQWDIPGGFWELEFLSPTEVEEIRSVRGEKLLTLTRHAI